VDAGREEGFVAIDVSHPCEDVLVHEQGLDLAMALHDSAKRRPIDPQNVILCNGQWSADVTLGPAKKPDSAKATDVAKAQLRVGVLQVDNEMGMWRGRIGSGENGELSGHSEMDVALQPTGQGQFDSFPGAFDGADGAPRQEPLRRSWITVKDVSTGGAYATEADPLQFPAEDANDVFDFGEFGHVFSPRGLKQPTSWYPDAGRRGNQSCSESGRAARIPIDGIEEYEADGI
jgi:hypothetical protein